MEGAVRGADDAGLTMASARGRWVLAATVLGSGIATLDATVVNIALPAIGRDLHTGVATLQWVVTGYSLTLAAFLLLGGSLGDRLGRRRVFVIGVVWFALASAVCGVAPDPAALVAARAVQGVGAALLTPASLAILQASFVPGDRARAIGAWSALAGVTTAVGPLVGGYLIAAGSWRWVFYINLPLAAAVAAMALRHVPDSRDPTATGRTDVGGAALAATVLTGLTYALIEGPERGWADPVVVAGVVVAAVWLPALLAVERAMKAPMLPLGLFASRQFAGANAVTFVVYAGLSGALFLLPTTLQIVGGYSALGSGLALLPVTAIMLALSARSGRLASRIGPRLQMSVGPAVVAAGLLALTRASRHGSYVVEVLPGMIAFGLGLAVTVAPLTATALGAAPSDHAGAASAVNNVVARTGGLVAVAVLPVAAGITGGAALHPAHLAAGFRLAVAIAAVACAAGGVLAAVTIRNPGPDRWHGALDGPSTLPGRTGPVGG